MFNRIKWRTVCYVYKIYTKNNCIHFNVFPSFWIPGSKEYREKQQSRSRMSKLLFGHFFFLNLHYCTSLDAQYLKLSYFAVTFWAYTAHTISGKSKKNVFFKHLCSRKHSSRCQVYHHKHTSFYYEKSFLSLWKWVA